MYGFFFREIVCESLVFRFFNLAKKKYFVKSTFNSLATSFFRTQWGKWGLKHDHNLYGKINIFPSNQLFLKKLLKSWFHENFWARSLWKKNSSNYLFSKFFSKSNAFTKYLRKKCERISTISTMNFHNVFSTLYLVKTLISRNFWQNTALCALWKYFL